MGYSGLNPYELILPGELSWESRKGYVYIEVDTLGEGEGRGVDLSGYQPYQERGI